MSNYISFASINLYNLQIPQKEWRNKKKYTQEEYDKKVTWTSEKIKLVNADVFAFQELWSKQCLIDIFEKANLEDEYELIFIKDSWYDIAVAAAVRKPWKVEFTHRHKSFPDSFVMIKRNVDHSPSTVEDEDDDIQVVINKFSRTILQFSISHPDFLHDKNIQVFSAHLKSKLETRLDKEELGEEKIKIHSNTIGAGISTIRRICEATALRIILNDTMKGNDDPVVVMGDLNDSVTSNALSIITSQAKYRLYAKSRTANANDKGLYSSAIMQNFRSISDRIYTHEHEGMKDTLDHILFSEQFYPHSKNCIWSFVDMKVWNDHVGDDLKATSDHGIIKSTFKRK